MIVAESQLGYRIPGRPREHEPVDFERARTYALRDRISLLRKATENDFERAAATWLAQIAATPLSAERLAEFEEWLAHPQHELVIARLIIDALDADSTNAGERDASGLLPKA
jgi:hypothetical protein